MSDSELIEVDPAVLENVDDEDYASSGYDTSTQSLTSSINHYVFQNGRRYHSYFGVDKSVMPNDEAEQDRLDMHHEIFLLLLDGKLFKAPLNAPQRILDVGTGTGIWAIDMADMFPMAEVIGTDLSPIQPGWVPPNCRFEVDDAEKAWTFNDGFDFVHLRNLSQSIDDWPKLVSQAYSFTNPGGYIELAEIAGELFCDDGTMADDNPFRIAFTALNDKALPKIGRQCPTLKEMEDYLKDAGCVDVHTFSYKHPFGPWAKDKKLKQIGAMTLLNMETGIEAYVLAAAIRILGMDPDEAKKMCKDAFQALKNKNTHMYNRYNVVYGQKPE